MKRMFLAISLAATLASHSSAIMADVITLKPDHPQSYVVEKGDTLWDISAHFLSDPWRWQSLWGNNPQIANPHLIYPGDKLNLIFVDGQPRLVKKPVIRKSPEGRIATKVKAIPAVDLSLLQPYLNQNRVVDSDWYAKQPQVLGGETKSRHHVAGQFVYVQGQLPVGQKVGLYNQGRKFHRLNSGEPLGQEVILTSTGQVTASGEMSTIKLLTSFRETKAGDRVMMMDDGSMLPVYFMPKAATLKQPSHILASGAGFREMGKLDVLYIDRGMKDGVAAGDVFSVFRDGEQIVLRTGDKPAALDSGSSYDRLVARLSDSTTAVLPRNHHGNLMVFKVFDNTSMGLIMVNERPIRVNDKLAQPTPPILGE